MMKRSALFLSLLFLIGCAPQPADEEMTEPQSNDGQPVEESQSPVEEPTEKNGLAIGEVESISQKLNSPWSIAKVSGGWLVSERGGTISRVSDQGTVTRHEVDLTKEVLEVGEGGLLGIALSEDFDDTGKLFAYHTYEASGQVKNRVVELTWDGERFEETGVLIEGIPGARFHNGGRLLLDGEVIWVTTGDALVPNLAQDETSLAGKILRIPVSGEGTPTEWIYSRGHRNPQGLVLVGETLYASEHGDTGHDEVNVIREGQNYGWPLIEGDQTKEGLVTPWFEVGETSWAPSGIAADEEYVYMATLRHNQLVAINRQSKEVTTLVEDVGRIRDVWLEEDSLYFISNNTDGRGNPSSEDDQLYRLTIR